MDPSGSLEWYDFGAGWFSGICGLLVGYPADTVKVQQQTLGNRGAFTVTVSLLKNHGVLAFYKGLMMPLVSAGVINAVFFGCYGNTVHYLAYLRGEKPLKSCCSNENKPAYAGFHWDILSAGCVAGFITTLVACPFDLVKVKLQTQADHLRKCTKTHCDIPYTGTFDCLTKLFKAGGFRFIYRGLVPMLWRDVPTYGLYILVYEHSLCLCETNTIKHSSAPVACILTSGALAGVAAWVGVMPIDVVKSRIQADDSEHPRFRGMIDCFRKTYRIHGAMFFMRGFLVTMARAGPVNAATFAGYEAYLYLYFKFKNRNQT